MSSPWGVSLGYAARRICMLLCWILSRFLAQKPPAGVTVSRSSLTLPKEPRPRERTASLYLRSRQKQPPRVCLCQSRGKPQRELFQYQARRRGPQKLWGFAKEGRLLERLSWGPGASAGPKDLVLGGPDCVLSLSSIFTWRLNHNSSDWYRDARDHFWCRTVE